MKKSTGLIIVSLLFASMSCKPVNDYYVIDVANPVISLNGLWKVTGEPVETIAGSPQSNIAWTDIKVPGECMMQGFPVKHDQPFVYLTEFEIPSDYLGKIIKVRFEGVYSYARVWVNGQYIRDHSGGFTAWECDITDVVKEGQKVKMLVEVTDKSDEISYASGYAKHQIGGILRNVSLMAFPENYPVNLSIITDFDKEYNDASLIVEGQAFVEGDDYSLALELYDPGSGRITLKTPGISLSGNKFRLENLVTGPLKWDAEHPNLYKLVAKFKKGGSVTWQKSYYIGFREIEVSGNKFLVNGRQVKLRGACRHDIHPLLGRLTTSEYDLQDVLLAKEANMNFIRTSHYPPSENFLGLCDKYGIYVEDETAVCFVGSHRTIEYQPGASENSDEYTARYLSQLEEMVYAHRNHPSVIMWSIGNENEYGKNFKVSYDWVKRNDPSRPVIFSYPGKVPDSIPNYDIISIHYPGTNGTMSQYGITTNEFGHSQKPVLFDEWAHVACYNSETVKKDPNVREFWGASLDTMWQKVYNADGGLGGAIWGMIDETFMLPADLPGFNQWWGKIDPKVIPGYFSGHTIGYGEWGIVDTWRRKKPEFWSVKKAYSPVRVLKTENYDFAGGKEQEIPVLNRFDFTNLSELDIAVTTGSKTRLIESPDIPPRSSGVIRVKCDELSSGEDLKLEFFDSMGTLIDSYILSAVQQKETAEPKYDGAIPELSEDGREYLVTCSNDLRIAIDRQTGLLAGYETKSGRMKLQGPFVNARVLGKEIIFSSYTLEDLCRNWDLTSLSVTKTNNSVIAATEGKYSGGIDARFKVQISSSGEILTEYHVKGLPGGIIRETGIRFILGDSYDSLSWNRKAYWPAYPSDHLSGPEGRVSLYSGNNNEYRKSPSKEWHYDKKSFFYNGIENESGDQLTNTARATKENILFYTLDSGGSKAISVYARGDKSCRIEKSGTDIVLNINDFIDYPDISWGNYSRSRMLSGEYSGTAGVTIR